MPAPKKVSAGRQPLRPLKSTGPGRKSVGKVTRTTGLDSSSPRSHTVTTNSSGRASARPNGVGYASKGRFASIAPSKAAPGRGLKGPVKGMAVRATTPAGPKRAAGPKSAAQKGLPARAQAAQARKASKGLNLPKFAGEVSRNYARGVARFGKEVDNSVEWGKKGVAGMERFIKSGGVVGKSGIKGAMDTGFDKNNPLKKILKK